MLAGVKQTGTRGDRVRGWRRLAVAIWPEPNDPQMFGDIEVDAGSALAFIERERDRTGVHVTILHVAGKALAHALSEHPELNVLPHGDRLTPRGRVDVAFIVGLDEGETNAGVRVRDADRKAVADIARELQSRAASLRTRADPSVERFARLVDHVPLWLLRLGLRAGVWLTVDRGLDLGLPGLEPGGFGSALITSVGGMGIDHGYPMLTPFGRVPIAVMLGRVTRRPVADGDEVVIRPMLTLSAVLDHRFLDGSHAGRLVTSMRAYLADPEAFEPSADADYAPASAAMNPSRRTS
jgi:pyruvate dehydrogenase E2 component (dihydrolipoamide acetyltransferase)